MVIGELCFVKTKQKCLLESPYIELGSDNFGQFLAKKSNFQIFTNPPSDAGKHKIDYKVIVGMAGF